MKSKKLQLKRENVRELSREDLTGAAGGTGALVAAGWVGPRPPGPGPVGQSLGCAAFQINLAYLKY